MFLFYFFFTFGSNGWGGPLANAWVIEYSVDPRRYPNFSHQIIQKNHYFIRWFLHSFYCILGIGCSTSKHQQPTWHVHLRRLRGRERAEVANRLRGWIQCILRRGFFHFFYSTPPTWLIVGNNFCSWLHWLWQRIISSVVVRCTMFMNGQLMHCTSFYLVGLCEYKFIPYISQHEMAIICIYIFSSDTLNMTVIRFGCRKKHVVISGTCVNWAHRSAHSPDSLELNAWEKTSWHCCAFIVRWKILQNHENLFARVERRWNTWTIWLQTKKGKLNWKGAQINNKQILIFIASSVVGFSANAFYRSSYLCVFINYVLVHFSFYRFNQSQRIFQKAHKICL